MNSRTARTKVSSFVQEDFGCGITFLLGPGDHLAEGSKVPVHQFVVAVSEIWPVLEYVGFLV